MEYRRKRQLVATILAGVLSAVTNPSAGQSNEGLRSISDRYWDALMERYPTWATSLGDYRFNDRLEDLSAPTRDRWKAALKGFLKDVESLPAESLSADDRFTRDLLVRTIRDSLLKLECGLHYFPLDPLDGLHIQFPLILVSHPFRDAEDYRAYVTRLRAFPQQVSQMIANLRDGAGSGYVSPRVIIEKVIPQIKVHIVRDATRSEFFAPAEKAANLSQTDREQIKRDISDAITEDVVPAYLQLLAYVQDDYLQACRSTVGIHAVPNGTKIYDALAYLNTTVHQDAGDIHEFGLNEVSRIRGKMTAVQKEMGFAGTLDEFLAHMRKDSKHRFTSREELLSASGAILERTKPLMTRLFHRLPKADCVMKEIESFRAANSPVAYYNPPPEDASRPGYYYINTFSPGERLKFTLEALSYHEAIPGHHFQIALDQENTSLPKFRRYGTFTAYVEGWALYAEKLGYDIGGYQTPADRFGQLTFEMWRACRLVVDTGMHLKGWTRQQAIDYMAANTSLAMLDIESEIDRYISWPGQALAYKVGEIRISQLRRDAKEKLGDKFDLRAFNDSLLAGGAMPIDMLEKRMRGWIGEQQP